ncbi:zinc finger protein 831 [Hoplias malabaricus]|uniref:zinc finger protein 831 n=1 Tax=Hoplias malabaricus TaxID=27720 RepID=UPI0034636E3E
MATGKQGFVRAAESQHSVSMQREKEMRVQAPLAAMYIQAMPALPTYPQTQPTAMQDAAVIPLPVPMICANQALPILTLHIASGAAIQQQRPETPATSPRPKSAGKHVCPHCGRDCLKPSVLEKHLRCHTGERPYPCTTCGISFKTQSNLYKHKRTQAHARLSNESGKGDFSSQESTESSREACSSPALELQSDDLGDMNKSDVVVPAVTTTTSSSVQFTVAEEKTASDTEWALRKAAVVGLIASPVHGQQEILNSICQRVQSTSEAKDEAVSIQTKITAGEGHAPLTPNRTPLQRQEALLPKLSRGKSQSHDSTDSGFSESSELHLTSSTGDTLHDPSMDSLLESSMELQEPENSKEPSDETTDDAKSKVSVQEKQKLEEHILKLISENSVLVDDKHLVNVRPRKTVLSKQGSIDLPMPYTYKDSFHFEMRSSKHQLSSPQTQDRRGRAMYSSVPTQHSNSLEHAPLTRSSSLPFSVGIQNTDRTTSPYQGDCVPLSRRCSAGNIHPFKSVDQHAPSHRSLVRQVAVDCLSVAEASSVEKGSHTNLSSDGDCGDTSIDAGVKRSRRKKAQKFAYNKWYMYGGGTFKKLYNTEKESLLKSRKATPSLEHTESQGIQKSHQRDSNSSVSVSFTSCPAVSLPPAVNVLTAETSSQAISSYVLLQSPLTKQTTALAKQTDDPNSELNTEINVRKVTEKESKGTETQLSSPIPSERKKQRTEDDLCVMTENADTLMRQQCVLTSGSRQTNATARDVINQSLQSVCGDAFQTSGVTSLEKDKRLYLQRQGSFSSPSSSNQTQLLFKRHSSPLFAASVSGTSGSPSASSSISSVSQAKISFLPKYQLKIPCSTDGASDPSVCNRPSLNPPLLNQTLKPTDHSAKQCDPESSSSSTSQSQSAMITSGQEHQGTLCEAKTTCTTMTSGAHTGQKTNKEKTQYQPSTFTTSSIISTTTTNIVSLIPENKRANTLVQDQNTQHTIHSKSGPSISSVLSQPLQAFTALGQNQSVTVSPVHSMDSPVSHTSTSPKPIQIFTTTTGSVVQSNPATSVVISKQPPGLTLDTHAPACHSSTDGIPLAMSHTAFQGAQFEGKMLLVNDSQTLAQDTFYVQTADLQIVMQLISDEQLALIEPQIEKQGEQNGSHSFFSRDPETSQADTTGRQGIRTQCPDDKGTKSRETQGNTLCKMSDIRPDKGESDSSKQMFDYHAQNNYSNNYCPVSSLASESKTQQHVSALLSAQREDGNVPTDLSATITAKSFLDQGPGERQSELLSSHKLPTETVGSHRTSNSSAHNQILTNLSAYTAEQSCEAKWSNDTAHLGSAELSVTYFNKLEMAAENRPQLSREKYTFLPEEQAISKKSDSDQHPVLMTGSQPSSLHLITGSGESGELDKTKTETSKVLLLPATSISTAVSSHDKSLSTVQPSQPKTSWLACTTSATVRQMNPGSVLAHKLCQYKPLNQRGVCSKDDSKQQHKAQGTHKTYTPRQASIQHLSQQHCSTLGASFTWANSEEIKATKTCAHMESEKPMSVSAQEESIKCSRPPCGVDPVIQDLFSVVAHIQSNTLGNLWNKPRPSFSYRALQAGERFLVLQNNWYSFIVLPSGPWVGGSFQSSQHQREARTGIQGCVPQEPESGGDGERVGNNCMEQHDHAKEHKREGASDTMEGYCTEAKPHPHLSQPVINACHNTSSPAQLVMSSISDNVTPAFCEATSFSGNSPPLGEKECTHVDNVQNVTQSGSTQGTLKQSDQSKAKEMEKVPHGCQGRFTSLSTGPRDLKHLHPTCGHLLAHPLLVNAIQKEVQKETQMKNAEAQLKSSQCQRTVSEHKRDMTKLSVPNETCLTLLSSNSDTNQTVNATPIHTTQTNINAIHSNLICASTAQPNQTETNAPQCHLSGTYLEEGESSSSSDDEGKLVIELE